MNEGILGIDLGTSSVKLLYTDKGVTRTIREKYFENTPDGWYHAVCRAARQLELSQVRAIGMTSQVGTYVINENDVISWQSGIGIEEAERVRTKISQSVFLHEISMPHPQIISYPLPRLCYILSHYNHINKVCMPKDILIQYLTGNCVSDKYSWRGLANLENGEYSKRLLDEFKIPLAILPPLKEPVSIAGKIMREVSKHTGIPEGTPVIVGCNDFFAGLLGLGMLDENKLFDITGTSEHLGVITANTSNLDVPFVWGPYFRNHVWYGVTASSGASMNFGAELHKFEDVQKLKINLQSPIFLPYLNGERAPIWDANAKGVFFGISEKTTAEQLSTAVMEGVVFSLYHIYESMGKPNANSITVSGGGAGNSALNKIKASMFNLPVLTTTIQDTSVFGAQLMAACGIGEYSDMKEAVLDNSELSEEILPDNELHMVLQKRYQIFKELYPALKQSFLEFHNLKE